MRTSNKTKIKKKVNEILKLLNAELRYADKMLDKLDEESNKFSKIYSYYPDLDDAVRAAEQLKLVLKNIR